MAVRVQAAVGKEKGCVAGGMVDDYINKASLGGWLFMRGYISALWGCVPQSSVHPLQQTNQNGILSLTDAVWLK